MPVRRASVPILVPRPIHLSTATVALAALANPERSTMIPLGNTQRRPGFTPMLSIQTQVDLLITSINNMVDRDTGHIVLGPSEYLYSSEGKHSF